MRTKIWWVAFPILGLTLMAIVATSALPGDPPLPVYKAKVIAAFPHDPQAFTQGLAVSGGTLYEGTGHYGQSTLRKIDLQTGRLLKGMQVAQQYFGEGITILDDRIYQLTWKEQLCFVYDKESLAYVESLRYSGEGWGLANDGEVLFLSDGTSTIRVMDPKTFRQIRRMRVKQGRRPVVKLNELEFVDGEIYANVWHSDEICRIDPKSGEVLGWIDCSQIYPARQRPDPEHVLNGIALDEQSGKLYLTGKNWPKIFEVEIQK